ncbi:MAG: PD-(D/E)XK nuclease family protein, partial [Clostridiales bacterium]|nr:PD-(D/E)XK nuclease family protein [Clostridiales bacterium]
FAREAYTTIQQITASDVDINSIAASGATKIKLDDLALIKAEYDKIKGDYSDAPDKLFALIDGASTSEFIKNTRFYAIGYYDMTKLIARVFSVLGVYAKSFTLFDASPQSKKRDELDLFCAPDRISEYKQVATEIRDYVHGGGKYEDIAIICPSPRALKRILSEYEIPSYTDESKPLYYTPPLTALDNIYKLHTAYKKRNAIDCSALVALCKNPYIGCDAFDAEKLLTGVTTRALGFVPTDYEFEGDGRRAAARALSVVRAFSACDSFGAAVARVVELCDFSGVREKWAQNGTDEVTPILGLVELLSRYGSGDFDIDAKAFFAAAQSVDVNTLPRERDCVTVTNTSALRMSRVKKLFITDFNEGVLPQAIADTGLITDNELNMLGGVIEPTVRKRNKSARDELRAVVVNAGSVYAAYSLADGKSAAFIKELAEKINEYDFSENGDVLLRSHDAMFISKHACVPAAAREIAARRLSCYSSSVDAATEKVKAYYAPFTDRVELSHKPTISVSELSHWFTCPYSRFLRDAVGLKERRSGFGAPDFGIVVHDFMRRFVQKTPYDCSREAVKSIIDEVLKESDIRLDDATYSRMIADAVDYAKANAHILESGKYEVASTEYKFGGKTFGKDTKLEFIGFIDRFDTCGNRARIIDYKTGNKVFSMDRCLDGTDMQLPLYAYALPYEVTGMFYVRPTKRYSTGGGVERAMSGCMVMDVGKACEYDTELVVGGASSDIVPVRLKTDKDGVVTFSGRASSSLLEPAEFDKLISACKDNADVATDEIVSGYICRSPIDGACGFCPYIGICGGGAPRVFERADDEGEVE